MNNSFCIVAKIETSHEINVKQKERQQQCEKK